ncbi:MAG: DUF6340 family protein [Tannerella sp.]|jgi:hypothetical protein|nr:DUF6340 family protein [Tannerella sp.]
MKSSFPVVCLLWLAASCSSIRYAGIETYNPAGVTFPEGVKKVLVLNNASAQREVPFESTVRRLPDSVKIAADSAVMVFCRALGQQIADSPYFEDVRLLDGCYRTDARALVEEKLTQNEIRRLCEEHEVDAVISLDRLLFYIREDVERISWTDTEIRIRVEVSGVLRAAVPDGNTPLAAVYLSDTVMPSLSPEDYYGGDASFLPAPEYMLQEVAAYMASESHVNFVPYWSADTRWYYLSPDSRWKEATACVVAEKWDEASAKWEALYERAASWKAKARLASNRALCAEMSGQLTQALHWATLAHQHFSAHPETGAHTLVRQKSYISVLERRIAVEEILRRQLKTAN